MSRTVLPVGLRVVLCASALACVLLPPNSASACDCAQPGPPCVAFTKVHAVFTGKVQEIGKIRMKTGNSEYERVLVTFAVDHAYSGVSGTTVEVVTDSGGGDCGYLFKQGESYLVYASTFEAVGKLYTGICTRTRPLADAEEDLEYLNHKDEPGRGAGIEGEIYELARDPQNGTHTWVTGPAAGVSVVIEGESGRWTAVTDKNGRFRQWELKPGTYTVTPTFAQRFLPHTETTKVEPRVCSHVYILATPPP